MTQTWPIRELSFSGHSDWSRDRHVIPAESINGALELSQSLLGGREAWRKLRLEQRQPPCHHEDTTDEKMEKGHSQGRKGEGGP